MASTATAVYIGSRKISPAADRTIGDAAPVPAICTFAKTASSITAPNNADIPVSRSNNTLSPTSSGNISPKKRARLTVLSDAFRRYPSLIIGEMHRRTRPLPLGAAGAAKRESLSQNEREFQTPKM
jgi:hypothetical protein